MKARWFILYFTFAVQLFQRKPLLQKGMGFTPNKMLLNYLSLTASKFLGAVVSIWNSLWYVEAIPKHLEFSP